MSGGIAGVLIAFGVTAGLELPAVLAYQTITVWLLLPVAIATPPGLCGDGRRVEDLTYDHDRPAVPLPSEVKR